MFHVKHFGDKIKKEKRTMAILNKEGYFDVVNRLIGTNVDDEHLSMLEDLTDTYNAMEQQAVDTTDWESKIAEVENAWREKYKRRFFTGGSAIPTAEVEEIVEEEITPENITVEDLFEEE
jgi:NAD(P)H-nitrite reductase large subunit